MMNYQSLVKLVKNKYGLSFISSIYDSLSSTMLRIGFGLGAVNDRAVENIVDYVFKAVVNMSQKEADQQQCVILSKDKNDENCQVQVSRNH